MSWRDEARPIIARVIRDSIAYDYDEKEFRAALRDAYPWGPREHHPYKIWLDECAKQCGRKPRKKQRAIDPALQLRLEELRDLKTAGGAK